MPCLDRLLWMMNQSTEVNLSQTRKCRLAEQD